VKVLELASYFPKPSNPSMGTWALAQAQALARQPLDLDVVSFSSWLPGVLCTLGIATTYACCPKAYDWDGLQVSYPRWLFYPVGRVAALAIRNPEGQIWLAWQTAKRHLLKQIEAGTPDLIYAHHIAANGYLAYRVKQLVGLPYVVTEHSQTALNYCARYESRRLFYEKIVNSADSVVAVSAEMQNSLSQMFPRAKIDLVHNGVDVIERREGSVVRAKDDVLVIFCAAFFSERKGLTTLIQAFSLIADKFPNAILRIAGDGQYRPAVEKTIEESALGERVSLLGSLSGEMVRREMSAADVFALVSWEEPFGVVYLEAMSEGVPIICSTDCGINDVIEQNVHGIAVPPRDVEATSIALARLLSNKSEREQMGRSARKLVCQRLTWDINAQRMLSLFQSAVAGR